jgi:hypothetical protein
VRSDARRRQSKSCFRKLSDIHIVHRLEMLMRYRCTALHGLSVAYATEELKKDRLRVPNNVRASAMCTDRSFFTVNLVLGRSATIRECRVCDPELQQASGQVTK